MSEVGPVLGNHDKIANHLTLPSDRELEQRASSMYSLRNCFFVRFSSAINISLCVLLSAAFVVERKKCRRCHWVLFGMKAGDKHPPWPARAQAR